MAAPYDHKQEKRRTAVRTTTDANGNPVLNGIDFVEVSADQTTLAVHFIHHLPGEANAVPPAPALALTPENIRIEGGVRVTDVRVQSASSDDDVLTLSLTTAGDFSPYTLHLVASEDATAPPHGFDPQLAQVTFSFKIDCPSDFDCQPTTPGAPERLPEPEIDYLAKDYQSFRRLMLDRLAITIPDWHDRNPADLGVTLVELLAYAADHLSYYQDAVATEAYLRTARQRISVRRHARLLDYVMHEGANARVWIALTVTPGSRADGGDLRAGTPLLTRSHSPRGVVEPARLNTVIRDDTQVFETLHDLSLHAVHSEMSFYTWSEDQYVLPRGATCATLINEGNAIEHLAVGDILIVEERLSPTTGLSADANPTHRHAVRLTHVVYTEDPLDLTPVVEVTWHDDDALPFPLWVTTLISDESGQRLVSDVSMVLGNVVLADHGYTIRDAALSPEIAPAEGLYRPRLPHGDITYRTPYDHALAQTQAAAGILHQDSCATLPVVQVHDQDNVWSVRRDLLNSNRFAAEFVVETEADGMAYLRFGDGMLGKRPAASSRWTSTYRIGNGRSGNVGAEAIGHVVTDQVGIADARNPLPAEGGIDPEPIEQVRLYAPQAFRTQERAVTAADYASAAQRHPKVQKAVGTLQWTGSWYTAFVTVDRVGGHPVDAAFEAELSAFLERFRLAGHDLEIAAPRFVPLDIGLTICVAPGYLRSAVQAALLEAFSNAVRPDGQLGFFHPDNWTFGQPVFLSQVVAAAMQVPGVIWVDTDDTPPKRNRFQRYGEPRRGELAAGRINLGRLEIARLDHDPNAPENGRIELYMEGGL